MVFFDARAFSLNFVYFDQAADTVPVLSTLTNAIIILAKLTLDITKISTTYDPLFIRHLNQKTYARCLTLLVPILGNIIIALYDEARRLDGVRNEVFAVYYKRGFVLNYDPKKAFKHTEIAAKLGASKAMNEVGIGYLYGITALRASNPSYRSEIVIRTNLPLAVFWFREAAENGLLEGMYNYALCLKAGTSGTIDNEEAFWWFKRAAEGGFVLAMKRVSECYSGGLGTERDMNASEDWYRKALSLGYNPVVDMETYRSSHFEPRPSPQRETTAPFSAQTPTRAYASSSIQPPPYTPPSNPNGPIQAQHRQAVTGSGDKTVSWATPLSNFG